MQPPQSQTQPARALMAALPAVVRGLAVAIVIVTVAGAVRILTLPSDGDTEFKGWVAIVVLLVGLALATVAVTCATVLDRYESPVATQPADARGTSKGTPSSSEGDRWPPEATETGDRPVTDYVVDDGRTGAHVPETD